MYVVIGIVMFWIIMAYVLHERKGFEWKKAFLMAPVYYLLYFIGKFFGFYDSDGDE